MTDDWWGKFIDKVHEQGGDLEEVPVPPRLRNEWQNINGWAYVELWWLRVAKKKFALVHLRGCIDAQGAEQRVFIARDFGDAGSGPRLVYCNRVPGYYVTDVYDSISLLDVILKLREET